MKAGAVCGVLLLVALAGLSYAETGFALSIPAGTVAAGPHAPGRTG